MELSSPVHEAFRTTAEQKTALKRLGISTIRDILYHFPFRYGDTAEVRSISNATPGDNGVFYGTVSKADARRAWKRKIPMAEMTISDESSRIKAVWFNQPYIAKMFPDGTLVRIEGKVAERKGHLTMSNPKIEKVDKVPLAVGSSLFGAEGESHSLYPVYPESRGITSNWFYHAIIRIFKSGVHSKLEDPIPTDILKHYSLPSLKAALVWIHTPMRAKDAESARKRFAFEEMFFIQLRKQRDRLMWREKNAFVIEKEYEDLTDFIGRFHFEPTFAQEKAIRRVLEDFKKGFPMSRLLEGDVGSGKTAVAAATAFAVVTSRPNGQDYGNLQVAYMAPTEILAKQHFESFVKYFEHAGIKVGLITGAGCRKFPSKVNPKTWTDISRTQLLKWVAGGEIPILVGTHALIQKTVKFKHLAYAVIDEQHRFGTSQRQKLATKDGYAPHLLSMTATPIPRTLALTIYGDLDLTLLDQMPQGRKPIVTNIVMPDKRDDTYEEIRACLKEGRQLYVICPRIDEPDPTKLLALNAKSVKEEAKRLKAKVFPEFEIDILHSKMTPREKERVMSNFVAGKTNILCATSVVEVGVNVPNATMIVIEGGERFGLSQLHQLRGRVLRSSHQAYCYVFAEAKGQKTFERLKALKNAKNGFELAEFDLAQRGAGQLTGTRQWGISDVAMEGLTNLKLVEAARNEAEALVTGDPDLSHFPLARERVESATQAIHFE